MLQSKRKQHRRGWFYILPVILVLALVLSGCRSGDDSGKGNGGDSSAKVIATYQGGEVTDKQLNGFLGAYKFFNPSPYYGQMEADPQFQETMLKQMIAFHYLAGKASDQAIKEADEQGQQQIDAIQQSIGDNADQKAQYESILKESNIQESDLKDFIALRSKVISVLDSNFSDDDIKKHYDEAIQADPYAYIEIATVRHILVALNDPENKPLRTKEEALVRAKDVQAKLKAGGDWTELAKEYSDDGGSKDNGGEYKDANVNQWVEQFRKAALELPINQISDPVETEYGYHVMQVEQRESNKFEEIKDKVQGEMAGQYFSDFMDKDLPGIITSIDLPKQETESPEPSPTNSATTPETGSSDSK